MWVVVSLSRSHLWEEGKGESRNKAKATEVVGDGEWLVIATMEEGPKEDTSLLLHTSKGNPSLTLFFSISTSFKKTRDKKKSKDLVTYNNVTKVKLDPSFTSVSSSHFAHRPLSATTLSVSTNLDFSPGHRLRSISS